MIYLSGLHPAGVRQEESGGTLEILRGKRWEHYVSWLLEVFNMFWILMCHVTESYLSFLSLIFVIILHTWQLYIYWHYKLYLIQCFHVYQISVFNKVFRPMSSLWHMRMLPRPPFLQVSGVICALNSSTELSSQNVALKVPGGRKTKMLLKSPTFLSAPGRVEDVL